jgi:hypothetical protein
MQTQALAKVKSFESSLRFSIGDITSLVSTRHRLERSKRLARFGPCFTISIWSALLLLVTPHIFVSEASAQATLPPIVITETRQPPNCSSVACQQAVEQLLGLLKPNIPFNPEKPEPVEVTKDQFCKALANRKPRSCAQTRPAIPGRGGTGGNGCGSGFLGRVGAAVVLGPGGLIPEFRSLDEPVAGFFFGATCNAHDICYASQSGRQSCDNTFQSSLFSLCGANDNCRNAAGLYSAAVIRYGVQPYADSGAALQCYQWHVDMDAGGCGAQKSEITDAQWAE